MLLAFRFRLQLCILFVCLGNCLHADLSTVEAVLDAYVTEQGGRNRINEMSSIRASGHYEAEVGEVDLVLVRKKPNMMRTMYGFKGSVEITAFDGKEMWKTVTQGGVEVSNVLVEGAARLDFVEDATFYDVLLRERDKTIRYSLLGIEYLDRSPCYVVKTEKLDAENSSARRLSYIDTRTFRLLKVERWKEGGEKITSLFSEYERNKGYWIAKMIEISSNRGSAITVRLNSTEINVGVFNSYFARPQVEN